MNDAKVLHPKPGGPFSALTSSMWPQEVLHTLQDYNDEYDESFDFRFDEFGFKVEEEDGPEQSSNKLLSEPFVEDPQHRLKWMAFLEFNYNDTVGELNWDKVESRLPVSDKLKGMLINGIAHSLRPHVWMRMVGAAEKKAKSKIAYNDLVRVSSDENLMTSRQIEKDILRSMPSNACFSSINSTGVPRLRRILRSIAWLYQDIGYCQGMGMIVASLLLLMEEEDAFWMMCCIIEDILPPSYYSNSLLGVQADQRILNDLIAAYIPAIDAKLKELDATISLITLPWFLKVLACEVHTRVLMRIWDLLFCSGSVILFQTIMGMIKLREADILNCENSSQLLNLISDIPGEVHDADELIKISLWSFSSISCTWIEAQRRTHLAQLMADHGTILSPHSDRNLPKQNLVRRQLHRSKSTIMSILHREDSEAEFEKTKNIKQTEILVDLRQTIVKLAKHFQIIDSSYQKVNIQADYRLESHLKDLENYVNTALNQRRRAKALLDFEKHDEDELGFCRNDIINIISQKDDHCWIGELNGKKGWFPAKFVEILDERSKSYSMAGDDSVSETITDIVRGLLCPALKAVFEHGLKKSHLLGHPIHPWLFIEEAASKEVEKDFHSALSRLVLCRTYRLDEDGKVLTPEELLYKSVHSINASHDITNSNMDVKFRSLVCCGLNEQVLHLWIETLCACTEVIEMWYQPWSYLRSPGWVQVKCELRVLSQFAFNLSIDWELPKHKHRLLDQMRSGVGDMLIKHHLFSWEL